MDYSKDFIKVEQLTKSYKITQNDILSYWHNNEIFLYLKLNDEPSYFEYISCHFSQEKFEDLIKNQPEELNPVKGLHSISHFIYDEPIVIDSFDNNICANLTEEFPPPNDYNYQISGKASGYWMVLAPDKKKEEYDSRFFCRTRNSFMKYFEYHQNVKVLPENDNIDEDHSYNHISKTSCIRNERELIEPCNLMNLEFKKEIQHQLIFSNREYIDIKDLHINLSAIKNLLLKKNKKLIPVRRIKKINEEKYNLSNVAIFLLYNKCHDVIGATFTKEKPAENLNCIAEQYGVTSSFKVPTVYRWMDITPKKNHERVTPQKLQAIKMMIDICYREHSPKEIADDLSDEAKKLAKPIDITFSEELIKSWLA